MGNQASRTIERKRESRRSRRRSTVTLGAQSHTSQGNYNWIEENTATSLSANGINAALAAAARQHASLQQQPNQLQLDPQVVTPSQPRRKSITEFFTKRKLSFSKPTEEDYREYDRLQRQHYLLKSARKGNSWVPMENSKDKTFVDIGTGNGIWALEMASQHSQAQVIGLDIRLPPEQTMTTLKNLRFIRTDIHDSWPLSDNTVDLVFQRNMAQHIKRTQWIPLMEEMFRVLKPGGYLELMELDPFCHNPGPVQKTFEEFAKTYWEELEMDFRFIETIKEQLEQVGFEIEEEKQLDIPIGEWPEESELKQFGFINKETKKAYLRNRKPELINKWGIPAEDYDLAIQEIMEEFEEYHGFSRYTCWIVKKPL